MPESETVLDLKHNKWYVWNGGRGEGRKHPNIGKVSTFSLVCSLHRNVG